MKRIRLELPPGQSATYRHLDLLHDALVNALIDAGADPDDVVGRNAKPWNFAALGHHRGQLGFTHSLVVTTPSPELASHLARLDPGQVRQARALTSEQVDFSAATLVPEADPVPPGGGALGLVMLSPLVLRVPGSRKWCTDLAKVELTPAVNRRLSQLAGRAVDLRSQADGLYLRANPRHSVLVSLKGGAKGKHGYVIGMMAPLVLSGSEDDLRLAWYSGLGEKTRSGFGCIGLAEQGVGR